MSKNVIFPRRVRDSAGNWGRIIYFSELNIPDTIKEPTPEVIAWRFLEALPDYGWGDTERHNDEEKQRMINLLRVAIVLLPPKQQIVIYKRFFQDKPTTKIAKELGIGRQRVSSLIQRALKNIKIVFDTYKGDKPSNIDNIDKKLVSIGEDIYNLDINKDLKNVILKKIGKIRGFLNNAKIG